MTIMELEKIIPHGEDGQNQFKIDVRNADSIAAEMVAFSNSRGGKMIRINPSCHPLFLYEKANCPDPAIREEGRWVHLADERSAGGG